MRGLKQRVITAFFFVIIMLGGLFGGRYPFVMLFALINALCLWEFFGLLLKEKTKKRDKIRRYIGLALGMTPFVLIAGIFLEWLDSPERILILVLLLVFPIIFLALIYELYTASENPFHNVAIILLGLVYIGIPFALVEVLAFHGDDFQGTVIFSLLLLTWSNDTGAYLIGSQIGKTPLFPRISPKKTWEGSIGGLLVTILIAVLLHQIYGQLSVGRWIGLAIIVSIFGSFGDLVESMLKRSLGKKDSGSLLPGHGGILDRFDAFIFIMPFATTYLLMIR